MNTPVLTQDLANRLEQAELQALQSRLVALGEQSGNPMGVSIKRFGNATALQIKGIPGPSYNTVLRMGPQEMEWIDEMIEFYDAVKIPCQIEVTPANTSPEFLDELSKRGFHPRNFHAMLYGLPRQSPPLLPTDVTIRLLAEDEFDLYSEIYVKGFGMRREYHWDVATNTRILCDRPGWHFYLASVKEKPAAIAVLHIQDGIAVLNGAATLPEWRGRGCQTALLQHRMHVASEQGCELVLACSQYASTSMQNMQRAGLQVAYTKVCWVRPV